MDERLDELPLFDGFPYLVTKVSGALHHLIVLPQAADADLARWACRQYCANRLPTCLVLAPGHALYLSDGAAEWSNSVPRSTIPAWDRLAPIPGLPTTPELAERQQLLREFVAALATSGFLVEMPEGRPPTPAERARLSARQRSGVPRGLRPCPVCSRWRGEALLERLDIVVEVSCLCENDNRCAACGELFHDRRLAAWGYFEEEQEVLHVPAFWALSHACPGPARSRSSGSAESWVPNRLGRSAGRVDRS